ncbi:VIT family protein [Tabrizicola sp. J26]|uniref:VIT1/CCC1 transporter family protein n=1 Tax=Alitabrizicola rongguiensis TaxID=2909234 RepID=UPI001F47B425|nr:VIT family protein [Tabrizicola rongguiensis]MCF1708761.1 VIT family protein [Tabrizicola rongguiensis]
MAGKGERHFIDRIGWLRAAVLGANDGIVSTASLIVGVAAAATGRSEILLAGAAGLAAGALSMAAGEYVSVSSQADAESADLARERGELAAMPKDELEELAGIYRERGVSAETAWKVAEELTAKDALAAHARDELGLSAHSTAQPLVAAFASALSFAVGATLPLLAAALAPEAWLVWAVTGLSLIFLAMLGALGAWGGGAPVGRGVLRVTFWGAIAMAVTAGVGKIFGAVI